VPDLRFIHLAVHASFIDIVRRGALATNGMPCFNKVMDVQNAEAVHDYILDEANKEMERRQNPDSDWWKDIKVKVYSGIGKLLHKVM